MKIVEFPRVILSKGVVSLVVLPMVDAFGGGQRAWVLMSAVFATISFVVLLVVYFCTRETVTELQENEESVPFKVAIASVLKNKYWFLVLGMIVIIVFHQVAALTVGVYYAKYILLDENLAGSLVTYHHVGAGVGMIAMPFILKKNISKKKGVAAATWVMLAGAVLSIFKSDGIFLIISLALRGAGFGVVSCLYYGMLADSVDYGEWKTGVRCAAVTTSAGTVGQKLGSGIGTALLGITLSAVGYNGLAEVQTPAAVNCIDFIFTVFPVFLYVGMLVLMHFYDLDEKLPQIKKELGQ